MKSTERKTSKGTARAALYEGKRMAQAEFHLAYEQMPDCYRAELIAGVVHEPSPVGLSHGTFDVRLAAILDSYAMSTKGVQGAGNATVILGEQDEVQPDLFLRILPACGGQSQNVQVKSRKSRSGVTYVQGAPELVAEIADSTSAIDLGLKKERYALAGVCEYIVVCLRPERIFWFDLKNRCEIAIADDGVLRSDVFPGLWLHECALLNLDGELSMSWLKRGVESIEHKQFVAKLAAF